jgi:recombination protein RecT
MDFKKSLNTIKPQVTMSQYLNSEKMQITIANTIGKSRVQKFISDVITMCNKNEGLRKCDPITVVMGALHGTVLDLNGELGEYWLVPYDDHKSGTCKAQFQIGKAGMTTLALKSDKIAKIQTASIKEGEIVSLDPIQGEYVFKPVADRDKLPSIGYYAYFVLTNGGKNEAYWSKEKVLAHATEYSQAFRSKVGNSPWNKHFDTMAENVVLFHLLKRKAPKSREFAVAQVTNQGVLTDPYGKEVEYIDNPKSEGVKIIRNDMPTPEPRDSDAIMKAVKEHGTRKVYQDLLQKKEQEDFATSEDFQDLEYTPTAEELAELEETQIQSELDV